MPVPVPQFIKEETKIMGILTFAQLTICVGGGIIGLFFVLSPLLGNYRGDRFAFNSFTGFWPERGMPMYQFFLIY